LSRVGIGRMKDARLIDDAPLQSKKASLLPQIAVYYDAMQGHARPSKCAVGRTTRFGLSASIEWEKSGRSKTRGAALSLHSPLGRYRGISATLFPQWLGPIHSPGQPSLVGFLRDGCAVFCSLIDHYNAAPLSALTSSPMATRKMLSALHRCHRCDFLLDAACCVDRLRFADQRAEPAGNAPHQGLRNLPP
jgi:hypothetical protein